LLLAGAGLNLLAKRKAASRLEDGADARPVAAKLSDFYTHRRKAK
jgi:hypothetical protein